MVLLLGVLWHLVWSSENFLNCLKCFAFMEQELFARAQIAYQQAQAHEERLGFHQSADSGNGRI